MPIDVTFIETESYFNQAYLQGETSLIEDKDKNKDKDKHLFLPLEPDSRFPPSSTNIKNPLAFTLVDS